MTATHRRIPFIAEGGGKAPDATATVRHRWRAVALVAAVLSTAGCSGGGDDATPPPSTTASGPPATAPAASPTPVVKPSNVYPTNADGCHSNTKWSTAQAVDWVKFGQIGQPAMAQGEVSFGKSTPGFDGPLCQRITVQVQYWRINYRPADASSAAAPDSQVQYNYAMKSLKRSELHIDGRSAQDVRPPKGFASTDASPCDGFLEALYVGAPLGPGELPTKISTGSALLGDDVTFPTERVADYHVFSPSAPGLCDAGGRPTASPAPSAGYPSSGQMLPTPSLPEVVLTPKTG
ncbi:hypothetical protein [Streptomyces sp. NPDC001401]|uniref:hypothetical protein n=1 Tax=Streptomyces sp. NPDC001401 TaxID=3364570 RepID=UPI0036B23CF4